MARIHEGANEAIKMAHRTRQDVVHHDQRVRPRRGVTKGAIDPRILIDPVFGDAIPQHAGVAVRDNVIDSGTAQQMRPYLAAAAERAEQFRIFGECADQILSLCDF